MSNMEKYLPIGSVVLLKTGKKRLMITGFAATSKETGDRMFDYMGCLYPEGVLSSDKNLLFDHDQIEEIYYIGYKDEEWKKIEEKIKELVAKKNDLSSENNVKESKEIPTVETSKSNENTFKVNTDLFN